MRLPEERLIVSQQQGLALVVVLWMLVLLTIMATSYSATLRTETLSIAHQTQSANARALAEAGVWLAVRDLLKPLAERQWRSDGISKSIKFAGNTISIRIQDESGKIDLNTAKQELIKGLFRSIKLNEDQIDCITYSILDWRDRDNLVRDCGAEDADYRAANIDYEAKDGPFNSVEELRLVMGMSEEIFQLVKPALTVHSHLPGINHNIAVRKALFALPVSEQIDVEQIILNRQSETNLPADNIDNRYLSRGKGNTFQITSEAISDDSKMRIDVVILLKRNIRLPFSVLSWREGLPSKSDIDTTEL